MDNTTKNMCNQLFSGYYGVIKEEIDNTQENGNKVIISPSVDNTALTGFIDEIHKLIQATPVHFNALNYYPNLQKVTWSGTIGNGVEWATELGGDGKGFYLNADNIQTTLEETRALLKLHAYFDSSWVTAIREAIKNKDLSAKNG
jgi:hypothetical protein